MENQTVFYYIPLIPKIYSLSGALTKVRYTQIAFRKYLLIRSPKDADEEYTLATYFSDSSRNRAVSDAVFFKAFAGEMIIQNFSKGKGYSYRYAQGKVIKNKVRVTGGHYEEECTTTYICNWSSGPVCPYPDDPAVLGAQTTGPDCNTPPDPTSEDCRGTDETDGEYDVSWFLLSSTPQQTCTQVWVEDPPTPPADGGTSVTSITNNIQNVCLKSVFNAIGNPKLTNMI